MNRGTHASIIAVGIAFGFLVTGSGFGNYTTIHQALLFRSWYLFAVFGSAVAVAAADLAALRRAGTTRYGGPLRLPHAPARRRHVYGAAIFGAGFGLTAARPGGAVAIVATGGLGGMLVLAGLAGGMWLRGATEPPAPASTRRPRLTGFRFKLTGDEPDPDHGLPEGAAGDPRIPPRLDRQRARVCRGLDGQGSRVTEPGRARAATPRGAVSRRCVRRGDH